MAKPSTADDLRDFIARLEAAGELTRVGAEVDPCLELAAIVDRVSKSPSPQGPPGGRALLFTNVRGHDVPVLINAYGSEARVNIALGVERPEALSQKVVDLIEWLETPRRTLLQKVRALPELAELTKFFPKSVRQGPCQEVVHEGDAVDLAALPAITCWPEDAGPFITFPCVFTRDPESGRRNCGAYRMQVYDKNTTGMHWHVHKGSAAHHRKAVKEGARFEVAVAIGCDPVTNFCACLPLPEDFDELIFAGFLRGRPVELVKCRTVDLEVPAVAEFVLEGYVEPGELRREGPFGDHTGFYSLADDYPVFHLTAITQRTDPIYLTTIVGPPPMEDCWMAAAIERLMLPLMQKQFPEVVDMHMPFEGVFHNLMLLRIRKQYPGHARKMMHAVWGLGQAMFTKCIVVVDEEVDIRNYPAVVWQALNNIDPERDIEFVLGPVETLDHASRLPKYGSKMGIDATRKWKEEGFERAWPTINRHPPELLEKLNDRWPNLGLAP